MKTQKLTGDELIAARENIQKDEQPVKDAIQNVAGLRLLTNEIGKKKIPVGATICAHLVEPYDCCVCFPRDIKQCRYEDECPVHGHIWRALRTH